MFKNFFLVILIFLGCQPLVNKNFLKGKDLFLNFNNVLSPDEYAKTIYFYKDKNGLWRNRKDSLVTINIPYSNDFFSFSNSFINQNSGNEIGTNSRYISKYEKGIQTIEYHQLDKLVLNAVSYSNSIYIIFLDQKRKVFKAELYSIKGDLLKESNRDFLQQIRRVKDW